MRSGMGPFGLKSPAEIPAFKEAEALVKSKSVNCVWGSGREAGSVSVPIPPSTSTSTSISPSGPSVLETSFR